MKLEEFKKVIQEYAVYPGCGTRSKEELAYLALGLAGEAGEAVDCVKKVLRGLPAEWEEQQKLKCAKEIGDVFWYAVMLLQALGYNEEDILFWTTQKLEERKREGTLKYRKGS